jgi:uncharacterized membrane protein
MQPLGDLPGGNFYSQAYGVSADGSTIVGQSSSANGAEAFRWTAAGGMQPLGDLPGGPLYFESVAYGISADGSTIVGYGTSGIGRKAVRWTAAGGMQPLGDNIGFPVDHYSRGVSADGSTIVGFRYGQGAFRWTATGGMQPLGDLPGGIVYNAAYGVSADGWTIVGQSHSANGFEAYRWSTTTDVDLKATNTKWNSQDGAISATYQILQGSLSVDSAVALYWANGTAFENRLGSPISTEMIPAGTLPGTYNFNVPYSLLTNAPPGSTHLLVIVDPSATISELSKDNNVASLQLPDLAVVLNTAQGPPEYFYWNTVEEGGGFTFTYHVSADPGAYIPHSTIDFYWRSASGSSETLAYSFTLDDSDDGAWKAEGDHVVRVTNSDLLNKYPFFSSVSAQLVARIDRDEAVSESDELNNETRLDVVPLVVNVLTHGWNSSGAAWQPYQNLLDNVLPAVGSTLLGRVSTYVSNWDSNSYFTPAFLQLAGSKVLEVASEAQPFLLVPAQILKKLAAVTAKGSGSLATAAARSIAATLQEQYLLPPDKSNPLQRITLIGHSRGAAVNAMVSKILSEDYGYRNIVDYVALDGFSTDWPHDAGLIGDISIVGNATVGAGGKKQSYRVQEGLENLVLDEVITWLSGELGMSFNGDDFPLISSLATVALGDLRAPVRAGFGGNPVVVGGATPSNHINITGLYFNSANPYLQQTYVGANANNGTVALDLSQEFAAMSARSSSLLSASDLTFGFVDSDFDELGVIWSQAQAASAAPTGDKLIDYFVQQAGDPAGLLASVWEVNGDARLVNEGGDYAAQLRGAAGGSSISQLVNFFPGVNRIGFDLQVQSAVAGDTLQVVADGNVLRSLDLTTTVSGRQDVALPDSLGSSAAITFRLLSASGATLTIDDLSVGLAGDYDADLDVDGGDFLLWQRSLGSSATPAGSGADGDGSGVVDVGDLSVWQDYFGNILPGPNSLTAAASNAKTADAPITISLPPALPEASEEISAVAVNMALQGLWGLPAINAPMKVATAIYFDAPADLVRQDPALLAWAASRTDAEQPLNVIEKDRRSDGRRAGDQAPDESTDLRFDAIENAFDEIEHSFVALSNQVRSR